MRVLKVGAGAGNTLFPVLKQDLSSRLHIIATDFFAVSIVYSYGRGYLIVSE